MSAVIVDSNVLLDVLGGGKEWSAWAADTLRHVGESARLVINPVIYAEVSIFYSRMEDFDKALPHEVFTREAIPYPAAFLAGKAFLTYRRRGGTKTSPLPNLFIGAHALVAGYRLLTRDATHYRSYFPNLPLITP